MPVANIRCRHKFRLLQHFSPKCRSTIPTPCKYDNVGRGRQRDRMKTRTLSYNHGLTFVPKSVVRRRADFLSSFTTKKTIFTVANNSRRAELRRYVLFFEVIESQTPTFRLNSMLSQMPIAYFTFDLRKNILFMTHAIAWPEHNTHTARNRYSVSPILAACIIIRRLCSPARWRGFEQLFGELALQLSEIF